jgi:DNA end-binding protein Ku
MPRPYWKGQIRLALVSCGVELVSSITEGDKIRLNRIEKGTETRLRQRMVNEETGEEVPADRRAMGYQYEKGRYIELDDAELDALKIESSEIINIERVVSEEAVNPLYYDTSYLMMPSGKNSDEIFATIREALRAKKSVGLGRLVLNRRERPVLVRPEGKGMILSTLHAQNEVRVPEEVFDDIEDVKVDKQNLDLATTLIGKMSSDFDLSMFDDRYQAALSKLVESKLHHTKPKQRRAQAETGKYNDLLSALKASIASGGNVTPIRKPAPKPASKSAAKTRKRA